MQRDQFLRVNTVHPLPANLVTELLPEVFTAPSPRLSARRLPSALVDMLNQDPESPFHNLVKRASTDADDTRQRVVTDNSLVEALRESLDSPSGALFPYRNIAAGTTDTEGIRHLLTTTGPPSATRFPTHGAAPRRESRLMHGAGIRAMSRLLERVMVHVDLRGKDPVSAAERELARIAPLCRWTNGTWDDLGLPVERVAERVPTHQRAVELLGAGVHGGPGAVPMRFYFPDSQDLVSPTYDFIHDEYSPLRVRQRDDLYAHEVLTQVPYDGILVSKAIVDGSINGAGKYSAIPAATHLPTGRPPLLPPPRRHGHHRRLRGVQLRRRARAPVHRRRGHRLLRRLRVRRRRQRRPRHPRVRPQRRHRRDRRTRLAGTGRTSRLRLAEEFIAAVDRRGSRVRTSGLGAGMVTCELCALGRGAAGTGVPADRLGGMVPLKTPDILACLEAIEEIRSPEVELHLLGITRIDSMEKFADYGVTSFDSTSRSGRRSWTTGTTSTPPTETYVAIRVPQVDGNVTLKRAILAGHVSQRDAIRTERECLRRLRQFDAGQAQVDDVMAVLAEYETIINVKKSRLDRLPTDARGSALAALLMRTVQPARDRDGHLSRDGTKQATRIPQPVGAGREDARDPALTATADGGLRGHGTPEERLWLTGTSCACRRFA